MKAQPKAAKYPVVLREGPVLRACNAIFYAIFLAALTVTTVWMLSDFTKHVLVVLIGPVSVLLAAWFAREAYDELFTQLVLTEDAIEKRGPLGAQRLQRDEIRGYRIINRAKMTNRVRVEPKDGTRKRIDACDFGEDKALKSWFGKIPQL